MKNIFKYARAKNAQAEIKPNIGITESDYIKIYNSIVDEYNAAKSRQKKPDAAPSEYMRGLDKARQLMDAIKPYNVEAI